MRSVSELIAAYRRKGFVFCFRDAMRRFMPLWFTRNTVAIDSIYAWRTYRYLRRRYGCLARKPLCGMTETKAPNKIWVCWLQGFDKAPEVVKTCVASIEKNCKDFEIIRVDISNMQRYATLPEYLLKCYTQGRIPHAHFSDVLRTAILVEHGGIWIDSTVLLTGKIPDEILSEPLFMFQTPRPFQQPMVSSNWFIVSAKAHPLMQRELELLYDFWKREKGLINYYNFYILFYILVTENTEAKSLFDDMLYIPNVNSLMLQEFMGKPISEKQWRQICSLTPIHKLTWKSSFDISNILRN